MKNLTQSDVASISNINIKYYQSIERGERKPRLTTLLKIASALNIPFDFLLKDTYKEFLVYSILACLDRCSNDELSELHNIIWSYLNEKQDK